MRYELPTTQPEFMRPIAAAKYLGISRTTLYQLSELDTDFPRKIKLSSRCVGWRRTDLDGWLKVKAVRLK